MVYFSLKLTERVGRRGRVLAVDVRRFPLLFLRVRALLRARRNLTVVHGEVDDPHLPWGDDDAFADGPGHGRWWLIVARRP